MSPWLFLVLILLISIDLEIASQFFLTYPKIESGIVLITGSSKGIGKAAALYFHEKGFKVYAGMRNISDGNDLVKQSNGKIVPIKVDLSDLSNLQDVFDTISQNDKTDRFVGLIHNAATPVYGPYELLTEADIRLSYDVNLVAPAVFTQKFLPLIRKNAGRIVFISSLSKYLPLPYLGPYVSTKSGFDGLASVLRAEMSLFGAHVSVIASGSVETDLQRNYFQVNHIKVRTSDDEEKQKEMLNLYGCYYESNQTNHRNDLTTLLHTTKETNEAMYDAVTSSNPKNEYLLGMEGLIIGKVLRRLPLWILDLYFRAQYYPGPYCYTNSSVVLNFLKKIY